MRLVVKAELVWYLSRFASTDVTKRHLRAIRFEPTNREGYRAIATDGHRMTIVDVPKGDMDSTEVVGEPVSIQLTKPLVKACKPGKLPMYLESNGDGQVVRAGDETIYISPVPLVIADAFPDYRKVIPRTEDLKKEGSSIMAVNPKYVADFTAGEGEALRVEVSAHLDPIILQTRFIGLDVFGIIMPMRSDGGPINLDYWRDQDCKETEEAIEL